ncbi:uncharacterized protein LOC105699064 isoform X2 [Orussus abietinus]|uniref:uncharacterized protein LOC105699064 isoform X2 n=1 Tax=Orussus abietinus TaxID=222816 RepID=UPI000626CFC7|nr:uncharacterized protein LOC105699064 isoform X2 [Orussus abietinus]
MTRGRYTCQWTGRSANRGRRVGGDRVPLFGIEMTGRQFLVVVALFAGLGLAEVRYFRDREVPDDLATSYPESRGFYGEPIIRAILEWRAQNPHLVDALQELERMQQSRGRFFPWLKQASHRRRRPEDEDAPFLDLDTAVLGTWPEFTFEFDEANPQEERPFAVRPNDPRYYQDTSFDEGPQEESGFTETTQGTTQEIIQEMTLPESDFMPDTEVISKQGKFKEKEEQPEDTMPEPHRRAQHDPLVLPVGQAFTNDIYFIAVVAGCSAAAVFALVLIGLTWCRLQRGVKAAADIEYPAYGITGPNKDVSPSGDQRLAQSAQMYHFQHQKQQIIAMENRTAAARDPGSVSEAESDEENEEGDYTVYECPGLAPTGEMEVKNPLFQDDPTPATPAQNNEGDHM